MEQSTFTRLRKDILDKVGELVTNGTFSKHVKIRVQKSSVDAILHYADAENYMDRFNDIVDRDGPFNLPIPHTYGYSKN